MSAKRIVAHVPPRMTPIARLRTVSPCRTLAKMVPAIAASGTIVNIKDKTVILRIDDNVKIELEKSCVSYVKKNQPTS